MRADNLFGTLELIGEVSTTMPPAAKDPLMKRILLATMAMAALAAVTTRRSPRKADRDQPETMRPTASRWTTATRLHIFEGSVVLTQGTLTIRGDKLVVTQDAAGFQNGVATATGKGFATFRQRRDGGAEYVEGEAERIESTTAGPRRPGSSTAPR